MQYPASFCTACEMQDFSSPNMPSVLPSRPFQCPGAQPVGPRQSSRTQCRSVRPSPVARVGVMAHIAEFHANVIWHWACIRTFWANISISCLVVFLPDELPRRIRSYIAGNGERLTSSWQLFTALGSRPCHRPCKTRRCRDPPGPDCWSRGAECSCIARNISESPHILCTILGPH
jgi:hypothetical protein